MKIRYFPGFSGSPDVKKAFTLIEIMIVVAVILILATMVLISSLRSRITSNEAMAIVNLKGLYTALQIYYTDNNKTFPQDLNALSRYISPQLASGSKSGYLFTYSRKNLDSFTVNADPKNPRRTGVRYFFMDETGIVRYNPQQRATENDPITE